MIVYLDDGWACDSYERCAQMAKIVHQVLFDAGFLPIYEKSIFTPKQQLHWLGFTWYLEQGFIEVPENKMEKIQRKIALILNGEVIAARNLASMF